MATTQRERQAPAADQVRPRVKKGNNNPIEVVLQAARAGDAKFSYFVEHGKLPLTK